MKGRCARSLCFSSMWLVAAELAVPASGARGDVTNLVVTHTYDGGNGSLRESVAAANAIGGGAVIGFDIPMSDPGFDPTTGVWTIRYRDTAPPVTSGNVLVDGLTQTAARGNTNPHGPEIALDGSGHTVECPLLLINVSNVTVRGLAIGGFLYGIQIYGPEACRNHVQGNYIGLDPRGAAEAGNYNGIEILSGAHDNLVGGDAPGDRNVVSGNRHIGIRVSDACGNIIRGNLVGLDRSGVRAVPNCDGICIEGRSADNIVGGSLPGQGNVASGNTAYGVDLFGAGARNNIVQGNYLGTDATGTDAVPNTYGVLCDDRASLNIIGGTGPGEWNLISGNTAFGAYLYNSGTCSNVVQGNRIGTDVTGLHALPNETGVHVDGGAFGNLVDGNLISGNLVAGITLFARYTDGNSITRNRIGMRLGSDAPLGNGADGVRIAFGPKGNLIGGAPSTANEIAYGGKNGVSVESAGAVGNRISCNAIHGNRHLGIDLFPEGLNVQHAPGTGTGPNGGINSPVIHVVSRTGETSVVRGSVAVFSPACATVEVFGGALNAGGHVQGRTYLGSTTPGETGEWLLETPGAASERTLAATVTDASGNTSEFGQWTDGPLVLAQAGPHGRVTPSNAVLIKYEGSNFLVEADAYYNIASILTNGAPAPVAGSCVATSVWTDVAHGGTLAARFDANLTVHNVPEWWLALHGLTNREWSVEALDDQDGDGAPTWQEWPCDTNPGDPDSLLRFTRIAFKGDSAVEVHWQGGHGAWQFLQMRAGLDTGASWNTICVLAPPTALTNFFTDNIETNSVRFYRIRVGETRNDNHDGTN